MKTLYKSMAAGLKSGHDGSVWEIGKWRKEKNAKACESGFHASTRVVDAMQFTPLEVLALVEVRGKSDIQNDKEAWSEMRVVKAWHWKKEDSVALAIFAAEKVLPIYEKEYPKDKRPAEAIRAAKKWLKNPAEKNRAAEDAARAARDAAEAAARAAEAAARDAAEAAARAAAEDAAWAARAAARAAEDAARAARDAARAAARAARDAARAAYEQVLDECEEWIQKRIKTLEEAK